MKYILMISVTILAFLSSTQPAAACDRHGAGYGGYGSYGVRNVPWKSYDPQVSTKDSASEESDIAAAVDVDTQKKAKPSFSNAANLAASKAKARLVKKGNDKTLDQKSQG